MPTPSPRAADLTHLKPSNLAGLLALATALTLTLGGAALIARAEWLPWLAGEVALAIAFVQWFAILHECGHETLVRTKRWHRWIGRLAGFFSIIPFACWTHVHARHHRWTGWQDLDPTTAALVPRDRSRAERIIVNVCWRCWIPLFSVIYRLSNYWHLPRLRALFPGRADRAQMSRDMAILTCAYVGLALWFGAGRLAAAVAPALVLSLIAEDVLLLSQHTHVPQHVSHGKPVKPFPAIDQEVFTRSLRLPAVASTLLLHFDAHELHHMYPFVPGYRLGRIPYETSEEVDWWNWIRRARRVPGEVFLFQNRGESGFDV